MVKGLNLKSCDIGDVLMVDVGSNSREREVTFIQNLTKDAKPYVNDHSISTVPSLFIALITAVSLDIFHLLFILL